MVVPPMAPLTAAPCLFRPCCLWLAAVVSAGHFSEGSVAAAGPGEAEAVVSALAVADECVAGGAGANTTGCALSALQARGMRAPAAPPGAPGSATGGAAPGGQLRVQATVAGVPIYSSSVDTLGVDQQSTWILKVPASWSDAELEGFVNRMPPSCDVRFSGHPSNGLPIIALHASPAALDELLAQPGSSLLEYVEQDQDVLAPEPATWRADTHAAEPLRADMHASNVQQSPPSWGLDRIDQRDLPLDDSYSWQGNGGANVHVYVLDTGIRTTHQDFGGRAIPTLDATKHPVQACAPTDSSCALDTNGHGTHCAGTVGGASYGVAKHAVLHSVKIFRDDDKTCDLIVLKALEWVIRNNQRPAVVSASFGGSLSLALDMAVDITVAFGITMVVAAGNSNMDACAFSPARAPAAITVAATDERDFHAQFGTGPWMASNFGPCVDIYAPGLQILSAYHTSDTARQVMNGTSMACPHVSGAVALLLGQEPTRTPADVAGLLLSRATDGKVLNASADTPNKLLYTMPAGECCYWGSGCEDSRKVCNPPEHWCSRSQDRCILRQCNGKFFCPGAN
uniref:subtilisin n=1 Tax=Pyrodinium bahamense TaxID=73915 RepID=A0A7S0A7A7_9DINO